MLLRYFFIFTACALIAASSGCGVIDYFFIPTPEETALELFQAGQEEMAQEDWADAVEYFTKLRDRFPFSPYTVQAELLLANSHFNDGKYAEALQAYKEFESLHPSDPRIPYVLFQIGMANYKSMGSIDKPQHQAAEAVEFFRRLIQSYPDSEFAPKAKDHLLLARRRLAEHELFVADFYWRAERFGSAWERYSFVVEQYKDIADVAAYAEKRSQLAFLERQQRSAEQARTEKHGSWKDWFNWL
ncbi:MAG: outer membrane protein assembly factor BamD [Desulfocurvibacter africanus]